MGKLLVLMVILLLLIPAAFAFKIGPAAKSFSLDSGLTSQYGLRVFNDGHDSLEISVSARGLFSDAVTLEPSSFSMGPDESERRVLVTLTHPSDDSLLPGKNTVKIGVSAKPDGEGQFSGAVSLNHNLNLYRTYDGTFIDAVLRVDDAAEKESEAVFTLSLNNRGNEEGSVTGEFEIVSPTDVQITSMSFGSTILSPKTEGKLEKRWIADIEPGRYHVHSMYSYSDKGVTRKESIESSVLVGTPNVNLGVFGQELRSDSVKILDIPVFLLWNEPVKVEALITLLNEQSRLAESRSATAILVPNQEDSFRVVLEVPALEQGSYLLRVVAKAADGSVLGGEIFPVTVVSETDVIPVIDKPVSLLVPLLLLLIIVAIILVLRRLRKNTK